MAGLGFALFAFLILGIVGLVGRDKSEVPLIFVQYLGLLVAGFIGGRFSEGSGVLQGSIAAIMLFFVSVLISIAISTVRPSAGAILLLGVTATIVGSAGGALAEAKRR